MPLWGLTTKPIFKFLSGGKYKTRKVVATDAGWVHRNTYTDVNGGKRYRDEILVAIPRLGSNNITQLMVGTARANTSSNTIVGVGSQFTANFKPGDVIKFNTSNYLVRIHSVGSDTSMVGVSKVAAATGNQPYSKLIPAKHGKYPQIVELYTANSSGGSTLKHGQVSKLYVVWDEPLFLANNYGKLLITVANTISGNNAVAISNSVSSNLMNADNTIEFKFKTATAGTYKVQAQTIANSATFDSLSGAVTQANNSNTVHGIGTSFTTDLVAGDVLKYATGGYIIRVHSVTDANTLVAVARPANNITGAGTAYKVKRVHREYSQNLSGATANLIISAAVSNALSTFSIV